MRKTSLLFLCALALAAQSNFPIQFNAGGMQKPGTLMSGSNMSSSNGVSLKVSYATVVEPPEQRANVHLQGGAMGSPTKVIHRYMVDEANLQYFGYDLAVAAASNPGHFTVTISPLSVQPSEFRLMTRAQMTDPNALRPVPLPTYPPPQDVQDGDTISLDLLVSPDGKTKVVDYFQVSGMAGNGTLLPTSTGEPRDYTLEEGVPQYTFRGLKMTINGQPADGTTGFTGKSGVTLWMTAPNQGRYILSLLPHEGFQKSGTIRDSAITFESDGQKYELRGSELILGMRGAWNLYVSHDPSFAAKPSGIFWGTDRMENLTAK